MEYKEKKENIFNINNSNNILAQAKVLFWAEGD